MIDNEREFSPLALFAVGIVMSVLVVAAVVGVILVVVNLVVKPLFDGDAETVIAMAFGYAMGVVGAMALLSIWDEL